MDVASLQAVISSAASVKTVSNSAGMQPGDVSSPQISTPKDVYTSKMSEIASKYDVRNISPRQMKEMGDALHSEGLISDSTWLTITLQRELDNRTLNLGEIPSPDTPRDMLAEWKERTSYQPTLDERQFMQQVTDDLEHIASFQKHKSDSVKSSLGTQLGANAQMGIAAYKTAIDNSTLGTGHVSKLLESLASYRQSKA